MTIAVSQIAQGTVIWLSQDQLWATYETASLT